MNVDEAVLTRLWNFVTERQEVRYRRHVVFRKPPWTDDPVLRDNHFTNIYREDDPGTHYAIENILRSGLDYSTVVWNTLWYRMFGYEATWDAFAAAGVVPGPGAVAGMEAVMRAMVEAGDSPFTGAYMVTNGGQSVDKVTFIVGVMEQAAGMWDSVIDKLQWAPSRKTAHAALKEVPGAGNFVAFQALVDLCYPVLQPMGERWLPFTNDGWATCGPGAERGLLRCLPGTRPARWNDGLAYLVDRSHDALALRGFMFRQHPDGSDQPIDRANMANCLCEFDKYERLGGGDGKGRRRRFDPIASYKADREARGHGYQYDIVRDGLGQDG